MVLPPCPVLVLSLLYSQSAAENPACVGFENQIFVELLSDRIRVNLEFQTSLLIDICIYMHMMYTLIYTYEFLCLLMFSLLSINVCMHVCVFMCSCAYAYAYGARVQPHVSFLRGCPP